MASALHHGFIGMGGNLVRTPQSFGAALTRLRNSPRFELLKSSQPYVSPAWGFTSASAFWNVVFEVKWLGHLEDLLDFCQTLEREAGRQPAPPGGYTDRILDLDLLCFDAVELRTPRLTLPHPLAHKRAFVLLPLRELAPSLVLVGQPLDHWIGQLPADELQATRPMTQLLPQA